MNWKKSTTPSVFILSSMAWIHMNVPVRPIPSLKRGEREKEEEEEEEEEEGGREKGAVGRRGHREGQGSAWGGGRRCGLLAHDSDGSVAGVLLGASEAVDQLEDGGGTHAATLWPLGQVVLGDGEGGGVLRGRREWGNSHPTHVQYNTITVTVHTQGETVCVIVSGEYC